MKPGDLVYWKQWESGSMKPIPQIGLLLEEPIGLEDVNKVYKAKVLNCRNSMVTTLFNVRLDVLNETW